jgi:hypothetical protein
MKYFDILEGIFASPAKPQVKPEVKPSTKPDKKPFQPFRPPKPSTNPVPKNKKDEDSELVESFMVEKFEDEAHPNVVKFWKNIKNKSSSSYHDHPIFAFHGEKLSKDEFESIDLKFDPREAHEIFGKILRLESKHKQELIELAKRIVCEIYGINENDLRLEAELTMDVSTPSEPEDEDEGEIDDVTKKQINKRLTLNTLTQGSAIHQMMSAHHLVNNEIAKIDKNLLDVYTRFAKLAQKSQWLIDIPAILDSITSHSVGSEEVEWDGDEPVVVAKAFIFPVLVQELSKGIMEVLNMHGLSSLDPEMQKKVIKYADGARHEPWQIQIGPGLWKKFLKVIPKGMSISDLISRFSMLEPDQVHEIIDHVIDNPDEARNILSKVIKIEKDNEFESSWSPKEDESDEELDKWKI